MLQLQIGIGKEYEGCSQSAKGKGVEEMHRQNQQQRARPQRQTQFLAPANPRLGQDRTCGHPLHRNPDQKQRWNGEAGIGHDSAFQRKAGDEQLRDCRRTKSGNEEEFGGMFTRSEQSSAGIGIARGQRRTPGKLGHFHQALAGIKEQQKRQ